ncbi:MAG: amidohydrolase [Planctomycetota bacterium]
MTRLVRVKECGESGERMFDLVLHNGRLLPMADAPLGANAVAVRGGRIAAVGGSEELLTAGAERRIDLGGRTLLPGLNDAHVHVWKVGHLLTSLADLRRGESFAEVSSELRQRAERLPADAWIAGRGVNELRLAEGRLPTRHDLDAALPGRPVVLTRTCGHVAIASTRALELAGIGAATEPPSGGEILREADGSPSGVLTETAIPLVQAAMPAPTDADYREMIAAATRHQLALGITAATDPGVNDQLLGVYCAMDAAGELPGRYNVMRFPESKLPRESPTEHLRVDTVKFFMDGGLSGATAALTQRYKHADTTGVLRLTTGELIEQARPLAEAGWRIATHVIGDAAIGAALGAYAELPKAEGPHRLEHLGLPAGEHLRRAAELGVGVATQTIFLPELGGNFRQYLPDEFPVTPYPVRSMLAAGLVTALSSDAPVVVDDNPLAGVRAAVDRLTDGGDEIDAAESIDVAAALHGYTQAGAVLAGEQASMGSIEIGKWADLAVLDRDPLETPVEELTKVRVDMTLVGGEVVFER